jgi:TctA family transporter
MTYEILGAAGDAIATVADPVRLAMLSLGVLLGLFLGIIPGIGGLVGMALLLPFSYSMDPYAAFAMLLGMYAVTVTSDTIPAVMFGVPGTSGAQATVVDGNPMARKGEAGRALSAAFSASLLGGLFGALILGLTIPMLRPVIMSIGTPGLLGFSIFGIAMIATLSGSSPLLGLVTAGIGILLSMIGSDPQTGTLRYTFGQLYLWDGLPLVPLVLGLFALPELADLAIKRSAIATETAQDVRKGTATGIRDTLRNWRIVLRGGGIGAALGAIPGLGSSVVDWIAYGWAANSTKNASETFGKGDVRGVIAPESASNAMIAGALVPTVAFGIPGSATMAVLLGVFQIHGLSPGPSMLSTDLSTTYTMVWSIAIANILGAGLCIAFSGQMARIALLRHTLILPAILAFVFVGAFQASSNWGDLFALMGFAVIGFIMKQNRWPRPPLILGFVLGGLVERYLFISTSRYGVSFLTEPLVLVLLIGAALLFVAPFLRQMRALGGAGGLLRTLSTPSLGWSDLLYVAVLLLLGAMVVETLSWPFGARIGPLSVGLAALTLCTVSFLYKLFSRRAMETLATEGKAPKGIHLDNSADFSGLTSREVMQRSVTFFGYVGGFVLATWVIGFLPAVLLLAVIYMRREGGERWWFVGAYAAGLALAVYLVFDRMVHVPWPQTLLGTWVPALQVIPSV